MDSVGLPIIACFPWSCFPSSRSPSRLAHVAPITVLYQVLDYSITVLAVFQIFGSLFMLWDFLIHYSLPFHLPHLTHTSSSFRAQLKGSLLKRNSPKHCLPTLYSQSILYFYSISTIILFAYNKCVNHNHIPVWFYCWFIHLLSSVNAKILLKQEPCLSCSLPYASNESIA